MLASISHYETSDMVLKIRLFTYFIMSLLFISEITEFAFASNLQSKNKCEEAILKIYSAKLTVTKREKFEEILSELKGMKSKVSNFQLIEKKKILNLSQIETNGGLSFGVAFTGFYNGKKVFIKKLTFQPGSISESQWLYALNQFNLGVKIYGQVLIDNQIHLVTQHIEGIDTRSISSNDIAEKYLTDSVIQQIDAAHEFFVEIGINPMDLQFIITKTGNAVIIDPEYFVLLPSNGNSDQNEELIDQQFENFYKEVYGMRY